MVEFPALKSCPLVVGVLTIDFDHLIEDTSRAAEVFIAEMVSQDEKDLLEDQTLAFCRATFCTHQSNTVTILVVSWNMSTKSDENIAAFCESC